MQIPHHWRLREQRYNLTGTVCTRCGKVSFTPRPICGECHAPVEFTEDQLGERRGMRHQMLIAEPAQR